jgi:hypothetical protein
MPKRNRPPPGAHQAASRARIARADARAADLAPIIAELQAASATSLSVIATALKASEPRAGAANGRSAVETANEVSRAITFGFSCVQRSGV